MAASACIWFGTNDAYYYCGDECDSENVLEFLCSEQNEQENEYECVDR